MKYSLKPKNDSYNTEPNTDAINRDVKTVIQHELYKSCQEAIITRLISLFCSNEQFVLNFVEIAMKPKIVKNVGCREHCFVDGPVADSLQAHSLGAQAD